MGSLAVSCAVGGASDSVSAVNASSVTSRPASPTVNNTPLVSDSSVVRGVLDNGFSFLIKKHHAEDERVHLVLVVKAGSLHEEDDQRGLAHFIEHMAFNGTEHFEKNTLVDFFEKSGLSFGSDLNAFTTYESTQYRLSLPSDKPELTTTALDVMLDWAGGISFDPEEVESERKVVLAEKLSRQGLQRRRDRHLQKLLLKGSRFAIRETIGTQEVLESAPVERLRDFYKRWYRPENMAIVAVGDFDPADIKRAVAERFSALDTSSEVAKGEAYPIEVRSEPTFALQLEPELTASSVRLLFKRANSSLQTEGDYRTELTQYLLLSMVRHRLALLKQDPETPFTGSYAALNRAIFDRLDLIELGAQSKQGRVLDSLKRLMEEWERVKRHGFSESEIARARKQIMAGLQHGKQAAHTRNGGAIAHSLAQTHLSGNAWLTPDEQERLGRQLLKEISVAEVWQLGIAWSEKAELLVSLSGPKASDLPTEPQLPVALSEVKASKIVPYVDEIPKGQLMASQPTPGKIVEEQALGKLGAIKWTLSNGATVILKPTDFSDNQIIMRAVSRGGNALASGNYQAVRIASEIVAGAGVGELSLLAANTVLQGKVVQAKPFITELEEGVAGSSSVTDKETLFQLVHSYMSAPRRDEAAFEILRTVIRENLSNRSNSPRAVFFDEIANKLWSGSVRRTVMSKQAVDELDLDASLKFYKQRFANARDFSFVFVGDLKPDEMRPLVETYLASLPSGGAEDEVKDLELRKKSGIVRLEVKAGQDEKASLLVRYHGELKWSDPAHTDLVSLQSYLQLRLREVLREELGLVYSVGVSSSFKRVPRGSYDLSLFFVCKPSDLGKLRAATARILAKVKRKGVEASYIEKIASQRTAGLDKSFRNNGFWLDRLSNSLVRKEDPHTVLDLRSLTSRVTSENIQAAAQTYLRDDQYLDAVLLPK